MSGYWRDTAAHEVHAPGRRFNIDLATGRRQVWEPGSTLSEITALRARMWANGFRPVALCNHDSDPTSSPGKRPVGMGWTLRARRTPPEAAATPAMQHGRNTGLLADGLRILDIDVDHADTAFDLTVGAYRMLGATITRTRSNSGKVALVYRAADGEPRKRALVSETGKVECLGYGQQAAVFGIHNTGVPLDWPDGSPVTRTRESLPAVTEDQITDYLTWAQGVVGGAAALTAEEDTRSSSYGFTADMQDIASAVAAIPSYDDFHRWNRVALAIWNATEGSAEGFQLFDSYSEQSAVYDPDAVEGRWTAITGSPPDQIGAGTLFYLAREACPDWRRPSVAPTGGTEFDALPLPPVDVLAQPVAVVEITEVAVVTAFAERETKFVYDHDRRVWYEFRPGFGWGVDGRDRINVRVGEFIAEARKHWGHERSLPAGRASFENAVVQTAKSRMATDTEEWNTEPMLLGVPGGYVDLTTGILHPATPSLRVRTRTSIAPAETGCPTWTAFLDQATGGDAEMIAWLQRLFGYTLSGDVSEEIIVFIHGPGGTGKGTLLRTLSQILGDYAHQAPAELFKTDSRVNREYLMAELPGKRALLASETEQGSRFAEAFLTELTGNEGQTPARSPYGRPFNFDLQTKVIIVGNHEPALQGRSEAMERRMRVIPFKQVPAKRDGTLKRRLAAEHGAILQWMIEGCLAWQQHGLGWCAAVKEASVGYMAAQDVVGRFLTEACDRTDPTATVTSAVLFGAFEEFCRDTNAPRPWISKEAFGKRLTAAQVLPHEKVPDGEGARVRGRIGIRLLAEPSFGTAGGTGLAQCPSSLTH